LQSDIPPAPKTQLALGDGARLYADNCARCHGGNGEGVKNNFPNLAGNESVWDGPPQDIESMILGGFQPWHTGQSSMPEFNQVLSDREIAAIANYVRTSWGNKGVADATAANVARERLLSSDWVRLNTGTTVAHLQSGGTSETFDDISGKLEMFSHHQNCMLNAHFADDAPSAATKSVYLEGACAKQGSEIDGQMVIDGKSYPAALTMLAQGGSKLSDILLFGRLPGSDDKFQARIAMVSPTY
jgi:mono/diheme cytochrome c family protein